MSLTANYAARLTKEPSLPKKEKKCCTCRKIHKPVEPLWQRIASLQKINKEPKNDTVKYDTLSQMTRNSSAGGFQWISKNLSIISDKTEDGDMISVELHIISAFEGGEPILGSSSVQRHSRRPSLDAKIDRRVDENRLREILEEDPSLAMKKIPFFHSKAPILHHLCLFQNVSLSLIKFVIDLHPGSLQKKLFGWLTPLHLAAIRMTSNRYELLFWLLSLYDRRQLANIRVSILPFLLRQISCDKIFVECLEKYFENHVRERDHSGNTVLHIACDVATGGYGNIFGSVAYGGCRPGVVKYLLSKYSDLAAIPNKDHEFPLHCLLRKKNPPSLVVIDVLKAWPNAAKSRMRLNSAEIRVDKVGYSYGNLPIELACRNGASGEVLHCLYQAYPAQQLCPMKLAFGRDLADIFILRHNASDTAISYLLNSVVPKGREFSYSEIPISCPFKLKALQDYLYSTEHSVVKVTNSALRVSGTIMILEALFNNNNVTKIILSGSLVPSRTVTHTIMRQLMQPAKNDEAQKKLELPNPTPEEFAMGLHRFISRNDHVEHLDLSNNVLPYPNIWLKSLPEDTILKSLILTSCHIGYVAQEETKNILINTISSNQSLRVIHLDNNDLSEESIIAILTALKEEENHNLEHIRLDGKSELVMKTALEVIISNPRIQYLEFPNFWSKDEDNKDSEHDKLLPYWRKIQYHCSLNRVIRKLFVNGFCQRKQYINNVIIPSSNCVQTLYGVLRLEPGRWAL